MTQTLTLRQSNRVRKALRWLSKERYPTQRELADALKLAPETVNSALSGRKLGGMKLAKAVAAAMGWEVDILLNSKLPVEPPPSQPVPASL